MNLVYLLMQKFFKEEWFYAIGIVVTSVLLTLLHANGLSSAVSKLIMMLQEGKKLASFEVLNWFAALTAVYVFFYYLYKLFQHKFLTKLRQWIRQELLKRLLRRNSTNFSGINFTKLVSPINRLSTTVFVAASDWLSYIIPTITFLFIIAVYFLYTNLKLGLIFLLGNAVVFLYFAYVRQSIVDSNRKYEESVHNTEAYMQEILNNFDKILYLGQADNEIKNFEQKTTATIDDAYSFYSNSAFHGTIMFSIVNAVVIGMIGYLLTLRFAGKLPTLTVITFITILTIYRENMDVIIHQISDTLECTGRINVVLDSLKLDTDFADSEQEEEDEEEDNQTEEVDLDKLGEIKTVKFENVSHRYTEDGPFVLNNLNVEFSPTGGKIIGIRGDAGGGKSTMMKLLLKLNKPTKGRILINGIDINEVSEKEIRRKILYVDQKGRMFDRSIKENIKYGCEGLELCEKEISGVMLKSERVKALLNREGELGEKWSGGERQVSNVLGGLVKGIELVILDEPTNGLDYELKSEIKRVIKERASEKSCIIIISHDAEVYELMDETIMIGDVTG
jgi:ABC-type multidrug transport system fused ATPase/permease subunit